MYSILFWKSWPLVYQRLLGLLTGSLLVSLVFLWFAFLRSPAPALTWRTVQEQAAIEVPAHSFSIGVFDLTVLADSYVLFERSLGNPLATQPVAAYVFLITLIFCATAMLTIITTLSRFWYALGMGLFIVFVVGFRLELIQVFGLINKLPTIIILIIYLSVSFYFQGFNSSVGFVKRLLTFLVITTAICGTLITFAKAPHATHQLAATGYVAGIIATLLFIIMVSHEILASFITLLTSGVRQTKSLNHFLIISVIYLVNLFIAYANKNHWIEWDFAVVNLFLLLTLSGILGIWGFRQRAPQYQGIIEADPFGVYFFVCLASIGFSMIGWLITSANDPALETIRDAILYCHLGYGLIFILYVISNFIGMLGENAPVYKVLYKPNRMPYFTFSFAGLIATLAFVFYNTWQVPVHNAQSGYYNAIGDVFKTDHPKLAAIYYDQASLYGFLNHHSNYATADIATALGVTDKEKTFYKRASGNRPTEMSYLNWSQQFHRERNWHQAKEVLREGLRAFPHSGAISNTLGLVYANLGATDSALFFLDQSAQESSTRTTAENNSIGVAAVYNLLLDADSLYKNSAPDNLVAQSNALTLASRNENTLEATIPDLTDTVLNIHRAALLNNYLINYAGTDSAFTTQVVHLIQKPVNANYKESLSFACGLSYYRQGQVRKAFQLIESTLFYSQTPGKSNHVLGQWSLEQGAPDKALEFLNYALQQHYERAALTNAVALAEGGRTNEAIVAWDTLKLAGDSAQLKLSESIKRVLASPLNLIHQLTDAEKYQYTRYKIALEDSLSFNRVLAAIQNDDYKARVILDRSRKLYEMDELAEALKVFTKIKGQRVSNKKLFDEIGLFDLTLVAERGDAATLQKLFPQLEFTWQQRNEKIYFETLLAAEAGDFALTNRNFTYLATANPFFEEAVVAAAEFFRENSKQDLKAYNILTDALHANPKSVRLLKAYSLEAVRAGLPEFASYSLSQLEGQISPLSFSRFVSENIDVLGPLVNAKK